MFRGRAGDANEALRHFEFLVFGIHALKLGLQRFAHGGTQRGAHGCSHPRDGNKRSQGAADERQRFLRQAFEHPAQRSKNLADLAQPAPCTFDELAEELIELFLALNRQQLGREFHLLEFFEGTLQIGFAIELEFIGFELIGFEFVHLRLDFSHCAIDVMHGFLLEDLLRNYSEDLLRDCPEPWALTMMMWGPRRIQRPLGALPHFGQA